MPAATLRGFWLACAIGVSSAPASAETERVKLAYRASRGCPGEPEFVAEVGRRLAEPWLAEGSELARVLNVTLSSDAAQTRGELVYLSARGQRTRRVLTANSCSDLFSAMVLISVLAIQSGFEVGDETSAPEAQPAPPPAPVPASPPLLARESRTAPASRAVAGIRARASGRLLLAGGVGPSPAFGVGSFLELGPRDSSWNVRAGVGTLTTGAVDTGSGRRATFKLQYVELGICPELGSTNLALVVCGLSVLGSLSGRGERAPPLVVTVEEPRRLWLALALEPRFEFRADFLTLHLGPALVLPFAQPEFKFEQPETSAHQVPTVTWSAGAGVGVQFP